MGADFQNHSRVKMIEMKYPSILNEQNIDLWTDLNEVFRIELEESPEEAYLTYLDEGVVVIEIDTGNLTPAAFTHELLHIYMKAKGVHIIWDLKDRIIKDKDLRELFSTSLRVHIGNCLEHVKMLPIFLSLGFRNQDFIVDYNKKIMDKEQMWGLEQGFYKNGRPDLEMVDKYMGKFFAMKASNNSEFDYSIYFELFGKLEGSLFKINQNFWEAWIKFKIGDPMEEFFPFLDDYLDELKVWKKT